MEKYGAHAGGGPHQRRQQRGRLRGVRQAPRRHHPQVRRQIQIISFNVIIQNKSLASYFYQVPPSY